MAKQYEAGIFFDNEIKNISGLGGVCDICKTNMKCVKINETLPRPLLKWNESPFKEYIKNVEKYNKNTYLDTLKALNIPDDIYDSKSGIQKKEIDIFKTWLGDTEQFESRVAIFDWDRTITMIEGLYFMGTDIRASSINNIKNALIINYPSSKSVLTRLKDIVPEDILLYLLGGQQRLEQIRDLLTLCQINNVDILILTNNASANSPAFEELLNTLFQGIPYKLIFSADTTKKIRGKGNYLKNEKEFEILCSVDDDIFYDALDYPSSTGGKKKKTIRRKIYKKKTIKRKRKFNKRKK